MSILLPRTLKIDFRAELFFQCLQTQTLKTYCMATCKIAYFMLIWFLHGYYKCSL